MSISTHTFPLTMSKLAGGPQWNTSITVGGNGQEVRNANWQDPIWKFNAAYGVRQRSDVDTLKGFFLAMKGRETPFLLQVADDYSIPQLPSTTPQSIGTGDGSTRTFQIYKTYSDGQGGTYNRNIYRPSTTAADLVVYVDGVAKTNPTDYSYSTTTGIITFAVGHAPASGKAVTITLAKFYNIVRFDTDFIDFDMFTWLQGLSSEAASLVTVPDIPLVEVRDLS